MKFKKIFLGIIGVAALTLAACSNGGGNTSKEPTPTTVTPEPSSQVEANLLDGVVASGKVRVDIMNDNLGVRFAYGNEAVESKKEMAYVAKSNLSVSGTATANLNFVFVKETSTGFSIAVNAGIDKDMITEFLSTKTFNDATRVYIAISTGDVNWTKGLNQALDTKINTYIVKK